jgi:hypothetical protein
MVFLAEREGFEPSVPISRNTHLAGERLQPTRPSLRKSHYNGITICYYAFASSINVLWKHFSPRAIAYKPVMRFKTLTLLAEGVGFEPTVPFSTTVFKTASFNHSDIPPLFLYIPYLKNSVKNFPENQILKIKQRPFFLLVL